MARRSAEESNLRSLTKVSGGKSFAVTIPMDYVRKLGWGAKQQVTVRLKGKRLVIESLD